jgi:hypothetical protein
MKIRRYKWHHRIGWGIFGIFLTVGLLFENAVWAGPVTAMWIVGCISYCLAFDSNLPWSGKLWRAAVAGAVCGFIALVRQGEPTQYGTPYVDEMEYGDDGFEATMEQRITAGLEMWIKVTVATCGGVIAAQVVRARLLVKERARP